MHTEKSPHIENHDANITAMFAKIAPRYDLINKILSFGIDIYWRKCLVQCLQSWDKNFILDLATGTMDVALALNKAYPKTHITAMDLCFPIVQIGAKKLRKKKSCIQPVVGNAKNLPLSNASINIITMAFGLRNIIPREQAFSEMFRVLAPKGKLVILEFATGKNRILLGLYNLYLKILPIVGYISKNPSAYVYLSKTIKNFSSPHEIIKELSIAGFSQVSYKSLSAGIVNLYIAQKNP